jgi:hypothetical protein
MSTINDIDFEFEEKKVKVRVLKSLAPIEVAGEVIGPFEEGKEVMIKRWISNILVEDGIVEPKLEMSLDALIEAHWKETEIQSGRTMSFLSPHFYAKLREYLKRLKKAGKGEEFNRAFKLAMDLLNCRMRKIVALAATPSPPSSMIGGLSLEERTLYEDLRSIIEKFKSELLVAR